MLDLDIRKAILRLSAQGHRVRGIARALGVSRNTVKRVLGSGSASVPAFKRSEKLEEHMERIRELYAICQGNLVRVKEELEASGILTAYSTLSGFCRRHGIGVKEKRVAGRYHFEPGEEMQHDTSPHDVTVGQRKRRLQCASLVLCYSRMLFAQAYPTFNRFYAKVFLTDALLYFGGAAARCIIDNTSVILAHGTGKEAVIAPEMEAFGDRFGFYFAAHELGDKNRSARVERPFHYIECNFYPGRIFKDRLDLNGQLVSWCDKVNHSYKRWLRAKPLELFGTERPMLKRLPLYVPEVYALHQRVVDVEGYVTLHTNRYSVPVSLLGRRLEVREGKQRVRIFLGKKLVAEHERGEEGNWLSTLPEHREGLRWKKKGQALPALEEERVLGAAGSEFKAMVEALRKHHGGRAVRPIKRLYRLYLDYPSQALLKAVGEALRYGLLDLERIERMVLRNLAGDFFKLSAAKGYEEGGSDSDG